MAMAAAPAPSPRRKPVPQFRNPVIWEDLADLDIFRVGDMFYYSASNMHYSPGAPILRSYDLVHWEYAGHSVPRLDFSPAYDMNGRQRLRQGDLGLIPRIPQKRQDVLLGRVHSVLQNLHLHRARRRGAMAQKSGAE